MSAWQRVRCALGRHVTLAFGRTCVCSHKAAAR
jgi:hypothetical protein